MVSISRSRFVVSCCLRGSVVFECLRSIISADRWTSALQVGLMNGSMLLKGLCFEAGQWDAFSGAVQQLLGLRKMAGQILAAADEEGRGVARDICREQTVNFFMASKSRQRGVRE